MNPPHCDKNSTCTSERMTSNDMISAQVAAQNNIHVHNHTRYLIFKHRNIPVHVGTFISLFGNRVNTLVAWHPVYQLNIYVTITSTNDCVRWQCDSMSLTFKVVDDGIVIEDSVRLPLRLML
jgi:hypothetical protein